MDRPLRRFVNTTPLITLDDGLLFRLNLLFWLGQFLSTTTLPNLTPDRLQLLIVYNMAKPTDLVQGTLDLLILKTVALGPVHGYAIAQRLQQISRDVVQVPGGSLYPALHRLENRKLMVAEWRQTEPAAKPSSIA